MPSVFSRVFLVYNLFLYLVPKKLRAFLPTSWYHHPIHAKTDPSPLPPPRRMDSDELRRVFQMFDRNGDERITKKELNDSLESMGIFIPSHELSQMIDKIDLNGDGSLDMHEFEALYRSFMDERGVEDEFMREAFDVFDQNGDGFISPDELNSVLESLGLKQQGRAAEDCEMMITRFDADGDGFVDFSEFKQMMRGNY